MSYQLTALSFLYSNSIFMVLDNHDILVTHLRRFHKVCLINFKFDSPVKRFDVNVKHTSHDIPVICLAKVLERFLKVCLII